MKNANPWVTEGSSKARLVWVTPDAEEHIAYIARVSNPKNQENEKFEGLLKYCIKHGHVSVFEQASMCVEVITPLAIATQMLRHRSFCFQQFSLRYSTNEELKDLLGEHASLYYLPEEARVQDHRNRQNSVVAEDAELTDTMQNTMLSAYNIADLCYNDLLKRDIAKEIARFVLPQGGYTRMYVTGSVRSWMHYLHVRDEEGVVQWEHVELARAIRPVFTEQFPTVDKAFFAKERSPLEVENEELRAEVAVLKATLKGRL
jgi:flavin-dependent thymidylate synthase